MNPAVFFLFSQLSPIIQLSLITPSIPSIPSTPITPITLITLIPLIILITLLSPFSLKKDKKIPSVMQHSGFNSV